MADIPEFEEVRIAPSSLVPNPPAELPVVKLQATPVEPANVKENFGFPTMGQLIPVTAMELTFGILGGVAAVAVPNLLKLKGNWALAASVATVIGGAMLAGKVTERSNGSAFFTGGAVVVGMMLLKRFLPKATFLQALGADDEDLLGQDEEIFGDFAGDPGAVSLGAEDEDIFGSDSDEIIPTADVAALDVY